MALVTFSGYPSSGKTHRAIQLKEHLERRLADPTYNDQGLKVVILSDDSLNIDRSSYDGTVPSLSFTYFSQSLTGP
jgi:protein KTI12